MKGQRTGLVKRWLAGFLGVVLLAGTVWSGGGCQVWAGETETAREIEDTEKVQEMLELKEMAEQSLEVSRDFFLNSVREFCTGLEGDNAAYSPLNVYMALAMLAEITEGNSRQQILDVLGEKTIDDLRKHAAAILEQSTFKDEESGATSLLASSLWLRDDMEYQAEPMESLKELYHAAAFEGEMGSEEFNRKLRDWINEQTENLLSEQAQGLEFAPETVMALAATVYFRGNWSKPFSEALTKKQIFHGEKNDQEYEFMSQSLSTGYYEGEQYQIASLGMTGAGEMVFLLPEEGVSLEKLILEGSALEEVLTGKYASEGVRREVNFSVPKFDVSSQMELSEGLKTLGITDVFDSRISDFSVLTSDEDLFISEVAHAARAKVDEEGCEAAAYTVMMLEAMALMPEEEPVEFVLDRPFLFMIRSYEGAPLFAGVVNQV